MTDKEKLHQILSSLWKNDDSVGKTYYNQALQDVQIAIDLQEEPVSESVDFEKELYKAFGQVKDFTLGMRIAKRFYDIGKKSREPVSEDLEEAVNAYIGYPPEVDESSSTFQWQEENLWKAADGDDLPETDREVIALLKNGKVVFAHRPNPDGWDGKSLTSGKVEHYTPKPYDKGGWNQPNVKYWLDCLISKETEL